MALHQVSLSDSFEQWRVKTNAIDNAVGDTSTLNTTNKTSLVAAINEAKATASDDAFISALLFGGE